ncbi:formyltransferase family protein [Halobacterium yunchengense]|uniref:formyltransferase family protein n=1 Tax=Halobacterium yunchengense TaxID=3108497 RepID=UPI00300890DB
MAGGSPQSMAVLAEPYLTDYEVDSLTHAVRATGIDVPLVVVDDATDDGYDPDRVAEAVNNPIGLSTLTLFADVLDRERWWSLVVAERKLAEELGLSETAERRIHVEDVAVFDDADVQYVEPIRDGEWNELPAPVVDDVARRADVVVRYGFGLIQGDILTAPRDGVLSFHPADIREYRGLGPPQAYLDGRTTMGITLQRLTEGIDDGEIVAIDYQDVGDCRTLWDVYDRLRDVQRRLLATGIENLRDPDVDPIRPDDLGAYHSISNRREPGFALRVLGKNVKGYLSPDNRDAP